MQQGANSDSFDLFFGQAQALRRGDRKSRDALRMAASVRVFAVYCRRQSLDRAEKKLAIFSSRALEVADKTLDLIGHLIK